MSEFHPGQEGNNIPAASGKLTLVAIVRETLRLYRQAGWSFTRMLLLPIALMTLTMYGFILLLTLLGNVMTAHPELTQTYGLLFIGLSLLLGLIAIIPVLAGGWHYVVYWASLNRNAVEVIENKTPDFEAAYQLIAHDQRWTYKTMVVIYCALPILACLPIMLVPIVSGLLPASEASSLAGPLLMLFGILFGGLLLLVWVIAAVFFSFIFQIAALEGLTASSALPFLKSAQLTWSRFWTTLSLQLLLLISTNYLLNYPISWLLRLLRISAPLDWLHQWILASQIEGVIPTSPFHSQLISQIQANLPEIAAGLTDSIIMLLITALLLPLGTFAFTLLYRDIQQHHPRR